MAAEMVDDDHIQNGSGLGRPAGGAALTAIHRSPRGLPNSNSAAAPFKEILRQTKRYWRQFGVGAHQTGFPARRRPRGSSNA